MDCSPWNFPGKSTRMCCHFLLQGIFLTQGSNPGLPHCGQRLYLWTNQGSPKKGNVKQCSNFCTIALISHTSKVMLKILHARFQQYMNWELPDVQVEFRKGRGIKDQIANVHWIIEKTREFQRSRYFYSLTTLKPLTVWLTTNCGKFLKRWEYQTILPASW